ncbi:sulfatase-like hydrolase/transferase [Flaviaesturariibacter amylovorans]|uniref:Sulfatase N-terminal domain-containing protein n=1 Tax=Flaviaesturariibacter amylovorans TaxID=1084520 RepID=A0ABP8H1J8_9BACT
MNRSFRHLTALVPLLLLSAFFIAHGCVENYGLVPAAAIVLLSVTYAAVAALFYGLSLLLLRRPAPALLFSFALLFVQFFFGTVHDFLKASLGRSLPTRYSFLLPLLVLLSGLLYRYLKRSKGDFGRPIRFLNLLLVVLLAIEGVSGIQQHARQKKMVAARHIEFRPAARDSMPDVFLIVADEYAGADELRRLRFDNSPFLDSLAALGFHVVPRSTSNYMFTEYSTASLLNLAYLQVSPTTNPKDVSQCFSWIKTSQVARFFGEQGYDIRNYSIFDIGDAPARVPDVFGVRSERLLTAQTFTQRGWRDISYHLYLRGILKTHKDGLKARNVNDTLIALLKSEIAQPQGGRRFVYTHLLLPHSPYYYDAQGRPNSLERAYTKDDTAAYLGYLHYANGVYIDLITRIRKAATRPTVILFMSDHGYRYFDGASARPYYYSTVNAVYVPDRVKAAWKPGTSNVNQFRLLLNTCFGQQLPLLPDSLVHIAEQAPH